MLLMRVGWRHVADPLTCRRTQMPRYRSTHASPAGIHQHRSVADHGEELSKEYRDRRRHASAEEEERKPAIEQSRDTATNSEPRAELEPQSPAPQNCPERRNRTPAGEAAKL